MINYHINQDFASHDLNQDFEQVVVPAIYRHLQTEDYHQALEIVNNFSRASADRDENNWLKHKCDSWKALIFEKQERYQEALSLYKSLAQFMGPSHTLFTYIQVDVARVLHKIGNNKSAILEIEKALESQYSSISDKLTALNLYVDILEYWHESLPIQQQILLKRLANELGIDWRENDLLEPSNLNQAVKELSQRNQEANRRYSRMLIALDEIEDDSQASGLLRKYISSESVGYYRNLAIKELDELEDYLKSGHS